MDKQGYMRTCGECNAVDIGGAINHYYHCSQWDGVKGKPVPVSTAHTKPRMSDKTMKPSFPPRMEGWQYQYERAERLRELLVLAAKWAYQSDVVDTQMIDSTIGPNNEYADKEDWIESWLYGLEEELAND